MPITRAVMRYYGTTKHNSVTTGSWQHQVAHAHALNSSFVPRHSLCRTPRVPLFSLCAMSFEFSTGPCLTSRFGPSNVGGRIMLCDAVRC